MELKCTIAWAKMYEILEKFSLIARSNSNSNSSDNNKNKFNSIHLCEVPGAFICALNHYLRTKHREKSWSWFAVSLNPYYEGNDYDSMLDDDRLILHTLNNWYFGEDDTGDIMHQVNIEGIWRRAREMGSVMLITADGGINCQSEPNEQESLTAPLHYCEIVACLGALSKGGSFVLKMFTLFESSSITMLYLLSCVFRKLRVFKPVASKSGNSEVYVVCQDYQPIPSEHLKVLLQHASPSVFKDNIPIVPRHLIPQKFFTQVVECAVKFAEYQRKTIQFNLDTFNNMSNEIRKQILALRHEIAMKWIKRFQVRRLDKKDRLVQTIDITGSFQDSSSPSTSSSKVQRCTGTLEDYRQKTGKKRKFEQIQKRSDETVQEVENKRRKVNEEEENIKTSYTNTNTKDSEISSKPPSENSIGMRMMQKMGYQEGAGLGKKQQGPTEPIVLVEHKSKEGLGYKKESFDFNKMKRPEYWMDGLLPKWYIDKSSGLDINKLTQEVKKWKIRIGASFLLMKNSKFCSDSVLSKLQKKTNKFADLEGTTKIQRNLSVVVSRWYGRKEIPWK